LNRTVNLFRGIGSVLRKPGRGGVQKRTDEIVANLKKMEKAPKTSIRQLSQKINLSIGTTHTIVTQEFTSLSLRGFRQSR
jgi:hypothetical protein